MKTLRKFKEILISNIAFYLDNYVGKGDFNFHLNANTWKLVLQLISKPFQLSKLSPS